MLELELVLSRFCFSYRFGIIGMVACVVMQYIRTGILASTSDWSLLVNPSKDHNILNLYQAWWLPPVVLLIGVLIGVWMAHSVAMTGMPQMVGLLNAFGGLAAALEGIALYFSPK